MNKDNNYGFGLPAMGSMLGQMTQVNTPPPGTQGAMEMFPLIMMMAMMAGM